MDALKESICAFADAHHEQFVQIAKEIHARPEFSNYEFFASRLLADALAAHGFEIEMPAAGHRTGFAAEYDSRKPGPSVVFLAEYDALPGIGHGCGHNLFGATSALAGCALKSVIDQTGGKVRVYGTPGEEGGEKGAAKGSFVQHGYFDDCDAALCVHPGPVHERSTRNLGCVPVDIEFSGKSAHAASDAPRGINALDALILTWNSINALRQHVSDDVRIHGVIVDGGEQPNVIPAYAHARFYLRAANRANLENLYERVEHIVQGAALATGARGSMRPYQNWVENMVVTPSFDAVYAKNLQEFGFDIPEVSEDYILMGSSDVGNVSQVIPTIQPHISISDRFIPGHSLEFVEASCSAKGLDSIALGAKVLAMSALDLLADPDLLEQIRQDHKEHLDAQNLSQ